VTTAASSVASAWVDAVVARDITRAAALLHPQVDFRAMTPNRIREADGRAGVEAVLREWFEDPDEEIHAIEATEP
jgi:ketosteroid isomerase-like protein